MRTVVNSLAAGGAVVFALWMLGNLGIGNFYAYYGPAPIQCVKGDQRGQ